MEWAKVSAALEAMATAPSAPKRRSLLSSLLKQARASGDVYAVMRILLPKVGSDSLLFFSSFSFFSSPRIYHHRCSNFYRWLFKLLLLLLLSRFGKALIARVLDSEWNKSVFLGMGICRGTDCARITKWRKQHLHHVWCKYWVWPPPPMMVANYSCGKLVLVQHQAISQ